MNEGGFVSETYAERDRNRNIKLLAAIDNAEDNEQLLRASAAAAADFHPSLLAELDLQNYLLLISGKRPLKELSIHLFMFTLYQNLALRNDQLGLNRNDLNRIYRAWSKVEKAGPHDLRGLLSDLYATLVEVADGTTKRFLDNRLDIIRADAVNELNNIRDARRVPGILKVHLSNAHLVLLDQPVTRMAAANLRGGKYLTGPTSSDGEPSAENILEWLAELEDEAARINLYRLGDLARQLIDEVPWTSILQRRGFDGERGSGTGPCARCSMSFTSEAITCIDPRCDFIFERGSEAIFIPANFNVAECLFCGHEDGIEAPAMCYVPHRQQVVYCLPTQGKVGREKAMELFGPAIRGIRERYLETLETSAQRDFESSIELITESREQFLDAIHMGETIYEDHLYAVFTGEDGSGMLMDASKNVMRKFSSREMQRRKRDD